MRILKVVDDFDAMNSDRPYRQMRTKAQAVEEITRCSGSQFDPSVVQAFLTWVEGFTPPHRVSVF